MIKTKSYKSKKPLDGFKSNMKYEIDSLKDIILFTSIGRFNFRKDATTGLTRIRGRFPLIDYNSIFIDAGNRYQSLKKERVWKNICIKRRGE